MKNLGREKNFRKNKTGYETAKDFRDGKENCMTTIWGKVKKQWDEWEWMSKVSKSEIWREGA